MFKDWEAAWLPVGKMRMCTLYTVWGVSDKWHIASDIISGCLCLSSVLSSLVLRCD